MTFDTSRKDWSVLCVAHNGTVSLIRNVTLREAEDLVKRLDPNRKINEAMDAFFALPVEERIRLGERKGTCRRIQDSDIDRREIIGPEGWTP
jgi:hypothetical protein